MVFLFTDSRDPWDENHHFSPPFDVWNFFHPHRRVAHPKQAWECGLNEDISFRNEVWENQGMSRQEKQYIFFLPVKSTYGIYIIYVPHIYHT